MMKKHMKMMLFGGAMLMQAACVFGGEPGEPEPWNPTDPPVDPPVMMQAELDAIYISGHLGGYSSCPERGYTEGASDQSSPSADACAPAEPNGDLDEDYCGGGGGFQNCEEAQITLELSNLDANVDATAVEVKLIELLDDDNMVRAILPINDVVVLPGQMSFDGGLDTGEKVKVRVDYKGPVNLYDILSDESGDSDRGFAPYGGAQLRITVGAENAPDVVIITKKVYQMADVAT